MAAAGRSSCLNVAARRPRQPSSRQSSLANTLTMNYKSLNRGLEMLRRLVALTFFTALLTTTAFAQGVPGPVPANPDPTGVTFTLSSRMQEYQTYVQCYQTLQADLEMLKNGRLDIASGPAMLLHLRQDFNRI